MTPELSPSTKTRVAILGGGPAGLAAAFELTATEELRAKYDVTIYQSGWRVGGKCGQGRYGPANRIEINGTHYLFGAYDAAFALARSVFNELETKGDQRFGSFESQFLACNVIAIKEFFNGNWETWAIHVPGDGKPPGAPGAVPTLGDTIHRALGWIIDHGTATGTSQLLTSAAADQPAQTTQPSHWWGRISQFLERELHAIEHYADVGLLHIAQNLAAKLERDANDPGIRGAITWLLTHFRSWAGALLAGPAKHSIDARRLWQLIDIITTVLIGIIGDDVLAPGGFERIDKYDFREWLTKWGAQESTVWSAPITTWYNAIAAYAGGDIDNPDMSAGMGLRGMLRLGLTYQGAFSFQLSYEVGDSIIAPLYQVLKDRGVRFLYFHRVRELVPSTDGTTIDRIKVEQQVMLKSGDPASYDPFITLPNGRPVWPDALIPDQIVDPPTCEPDLLSFYTPHVGPTHDLTRGVDFDHAIYALPVATARWYCSSLIDQKSAWRDMVDNLGTTETQSLRLWMYPSVEQMGWSYGQAVLSGYYQPLATWENAAQLVAAETWPADRTPKGIATLFGAFPGAPTIYPGPESTNYPAQRGVDATAHATRFCRACVGPLWPLATHPSNPVGLDWSSLVALDNAVRGEARLATQSMRANVGPVEAYTQIHKGTLQYRMHAGDTGYSNLAVAGDWVRNGYEVGSVEGAVIAGQQAAAAIMKS